MTRQTRGRSPPAPSATEITVEQPHEPKEHTIVETNELMTLGDIQTIAGNDRTRLERAERTLGEARQTYNQMTSYLHSDAGQLAAIAEADPALMAAEREVVAATETIRRNCRQAIGYLESAKQPALTPEEMSAANHSRAFVQEDVTTLPPGQLLGKMRAAALAGDRAAMFLYSRYVPLATLSETGAGGEASAVKDIRALAGRMRDELRDTANDGPLGEVREVLGRANTLGTDANHRRAKADAEAAVTGVMRYGYVTIPDEAA